MTQCVHCWHDFEAGAGSDQADAMGGAWIKRMTAMAEEIFVEPEARELSLNYCCKCGEPRVDQQRRPLLRTHSG